MTIAPGLPFLLRGAVLASLPPFWLFCGLRLLQGYTGLSLPSWTTTVLYVVITPAYWFAKTKIRHWQVLRDAARHGAALAPVWNGKQIANLDVFNEFLFGIGDGFLGRPSNLPMA